MIKTINYLRRHHLALVAILIASTGTAWASGALPHNSVGTVQIRKNAVTTSKVKDRSLLKRDFRRGQLPAGSVRAYAWVNSGTSPTLDRARSKGFASVSSPHAGDYCLKLANGLDPAKTAPVVTPVYNSGIIESEFAQPSDFSACPGNQLAIITYLFSPPNSIAANPNISFTVAIP